MAPLQIQWGTITLSLDNETFRTAFCQGRQMYFDDCEYDRPQVAAHMSTLDVAGSVLDDDGKGGYRFDRLAFRGPFDILGYFLGYVSGPIVPESQEEREERHRHVVIIPEEAS